MASDIVLYEGDDTEQDDTAKYVIQPYLDLVTWQHQRPKFLETILHSIRGQAQEISLLLGIPQLFDIDTAVGQQLDYTGQWIGVSRYITTALGNVYFSWDDDAIGFDQGVWWQPFTSTTEFYMLDDEHYRFLLKARIVSNHWDGTIPNAYEAWDTLFAPEDYQVLIQDGMASAVAEFKFDTNDREGWNSGSWSRLTSRTNFIRNSALIGAMPGTSESSNIEDLPIYWGMRTGLDFYIPSIYDINDPNVGRMIDVFNLIFSGTTIDEFSDIYFEEPGNLVVVPGQVYTLSSYFQVTITNPEVNRYSLVFRTYHENGSFYRDYENSLDQSPSILKRDSFTFTIPDKVKTIQVGVRFYHGDGRIVSRFGILLGQPQLELADTISNPIRTTGNSLVVYDQALPENFLNSAGHMIYALIAPYASPPPPPKYFTWDTFTVDTTPNYDKYRITEFDSTRITEDDKLRLIEESQLVYNRATESGATRITKDGSVRTAERGFRSEEQLPDGDIITSSDPFFGWDFGYWDVTPSLVVPPTIDAVIMALFTGGYIDLRPAGVTIDYITQSLVGTPIFAFDVRANITVHEPDYLTWDSDDAHGWDIGVWDGTQPTYDSDIRAPPQHLAGWDLGAWGTLNKPLDVPIVTPYPEQALAA